jgi:hypothetical protein
VTNRHLDPAELDALVLRELSSLPSFTPSRGFGERVMARVSLPRPMAVVALRRVTGWLMQPRRVVALASAYAFSVVVIVGLAGPWLGAHAWMLGGVSSWAVAHLSAWLNGAMATAAGWVIRSRLPEALQSLAGVGPKLWAGLVASSLAYAASGYGLHRLLRAPRRSDANVARAL